jgi:hypothetical protein
LRDEQKGNLLHLLTIDAFDNTLHWIGEKGVLDLGLTEPSALSSGEQEHLSRRYYLRHLNEQFHG